MPYNCGLLSGFGATALQSAAQCLELKWEEEAEGVGRPLKDKLQYI